MGKGHGLGAKGTRTAVAPKSEAKQTDVNEVPPGRLHEVPPGRLHEVPPGRLHEVPPGRLSFSTARLRCIWLSSFVMSGLLSGKIGDIEGMVVSKEWLLESSAVLRRRVDQIKQKPHHAPFLLRAIIDVSSQSVIGRIGFHGAPGVNELHAPDALELGYGIDPAYRQKGYATEAVIGMMDWAEREYGIRHFVASIGPQNVASQALARKLGFHAVGRHIDEIDGEEIELELRREGATVLEPVTTLM